MSEEKQDSDQEDLVFSQDEDSQKDIQESRSRHNEPTNQPANLLRNMGDSSFGEQVITN